MHKVGDKFARLTILKLDGEYWYCKCDCNREKRIYKYDVISGKTKSCGCFNKERAAENLRKSMTVHGMSGTHEWNCWTSMNERCHDEKSLSYEKYGRCGIFVCDEWRQKGRGSDGFMNFFKDIGPAPSIRHTIDRIDNSKGYYKENVRWATKKEQAHNKINNVNINAFGKTQCLAVWAREVGLSVTTIRLKLLKGLTPEQALTKLSTEEHLQNHKKNMRNKETNVFLTAFGKTQCMAAWEEETGIDDSIISRRLQNGFTPEIALTAPVGTLKKEPEFTKKPKVNGKLRTHLPEYFTWSSIVNSNDSVEISPSWLGEAGFDVFYAEIGQKPSEKHRIERIDKSKIYSKNNVRWATIAEIVSKRKNIIMLTAFGKTQSMMEWVKETGFNRTTIQRRIKCGWSHEDALTIKPELNSGKKH